MGYRAVIDCMQYPKYPIVILLALHILCVPLFVNVAESQVDGG